MRTKSQSRLYEKLLIDHDKALSQPPISAELERIFSSIGRYKLKIPLDPYYYLSLSEAPEAKRITALWSSLKFNERKLLTIEDLCVACDCPTPLCLDLILMSIQKSNRHMAAAVVSATHPAVAGATIDLALNSRNEGIRLRAQEVIHRSVGFTPIPRTAQTIVNVSAASHAQSGSFAAGGLAPAPEQTIRRLSERLNELRGGTRQLPVPSAELTVPLPSPAESEKVLEIEQPFARRTEPTVEFRALDAWEEDEEEST